MNRDDYMNGTVDHQTFYCAVADAIGRKYIEGLVSLIATPQEIKEALETDEHLNNIPLREWDNMHDPVLQAVRENGRAVMAVSWSAKAKLSAGKVAWSLSDTVCTLKAAARRMAQELA